MKRLLIALLLLGACHDTEVDAELAADCNRGPVHARDPASGACLEFASVCTVPAEWTSCTPEVTCQGPTDCQATEHCAEDSHHCVLNALCDGDAACSSGTCNFSAPHDCAAGDTHCASLGVCEQGGLAPADQACASSESCQPDEVCPAALSACSADSAGGCPSYCEKACTGDEMCLAGLHCNIAEVCVGTLQSPDCRGFCE